MTIEIVNKLLSLNNKATSKQVNMELTLQAQYQNCYPVIKKKKK